MKQSLRVALAIVLLSGLAPRVAVGGNCRADSKDPWQSASQALYYPTEEKRVAADVQVATIGDLAEKFDCWAEQESKNRSWISELPQCECQTGNMNGNRNFEAPSAPKDPLVEKYHPDAYICYRSKMTPHGHGQQCCYDNSGALFTFGKSAGSPDLAAPAQLSAHMRNDVDPVVWAAAKMRILKGEPRDQPWKPYKPGDYNDAWVVYNALRDDPRVTSCPPNPSGSIEIKDLYLKGSKTKTNVIFFQDKKESKRFLRPDEVN